MKQAFVFLQGGSPTSHCAGERWAPDSEEREVRGATRAASQEEDCERSVEERSQQCAEERGKGLGACHKTFPVVFRGQRMGILSFP